MGQVQEAKQWPQYQADSSLNPWEKINKSGAVVKYCAAFSPRGGRVSILKISTSCFLNLFSSIIEPVYVRAGRPGFDSRQGQTIFLFFIASKLPLSPRIKRSLRESYHQPQILRAEVKNGGANLHSPLHLHGVVLGHPAFILSVRKSNRLGSSTELANTLTVVCLCAHRCSSTPALNSEGRLAELPKNGAKLTRDCSEHAAPHQSESQATKL
jgi:hypothetical protein